MKEMKELYANCILGSDLSPEQSVKAAMYAIGALSKRDVDISRMRMIWTPADDDTVGLAFFAPVKESLPQDTQAPEAEAE